MNMKMYAEANNNGLGTYSDLEYVMETLYAWTTDLKRIAGALRQADIISGVEVLQYAEDAYQHLRFGMTEDEKKALIEFLVNEDVDSVGRFCLAYNRWLNDN